ncbi:unnamed protein product [Cyclocybe aegerita]|uniref:Uncharacterized protein n=1 Tax=Cyclocybe aegerita TaxID=1973307 RepID=A0A8S0XZ40_CYCAE|nr:unnamed protein product [Cyclocybe aegerita]
MDFLRSSAVLRRCLELRFASHPLHGSPLQSAATMSIFNSRNCLSVAPFSNLPAIYTLPAISRASASVAGSIFASVKSATYDVISRDERCLITKSISYTHERAHWVNAARSDADRKEEVEEFLVNLDIVDAAFNLDDASNLSNLDRAVHKSLDSYA